MEDEPVEGARSRIEGVADRLVSGSSSRPRATLFVLAIVTALLSSGLLRLRFETGVLDWLPRRDPHVQAFQRILSRLDGVTNQEMLWVELDPEKAARAGVETIFEETAVRAQVELVDYVRSRVPRIRHTFGLPHWFSLIHQANFGGDPSRYRLPDSSLEFDLIWKALWATNQSFLGPILSKDKKGTTLGLVVEGNPLSQLARDVGASIEGAIEQYKEDPDLEYDLFREDLLVPVGLASGTSLIDRSLRSGVRSLLPFALSLIVICLVVALRRIVVAAAGITTVVLGVLWTYGLMGHLNVPLNIVNVALVPLVFGCGVDYSIHILNEYLQRRASNGAVAAALRETARTSGVGVLLTTLTTVVGLLAISLADSPGMVQLGLLASFAMSSLALLALTFLPAVLTLRPGTSGEEQVQESRGLGAVMEFFARRRAFSIGIFVGLTALLGFLSGKPVYLVDVIAGNYRPEEPIARAVNRMKEQASGAFPEFIIIEGDLADPRTIETAEALKLEIARSEVLGENVSIASFVDVYGAYQILGKGSLAAIPAYVEAGGDLARAVPETRRELADSLTEMNANPAWRPLSSLFMEPRGEIGVLICMVKEGLTGLAGAERIWNELDRIVTSTPSDTARVSYLGYRTMSYLFITNSLFWLRVLFVVSFLCAMGLVLLFLRDRRALIAVGCIMLATGAWWLGLLRLRDIYISTFLLFPLIFIICIGSDYSLHLCWRLSRGEARELVWRTTGRAILYSAITDGGVFALFATLRLVSASQVMEAVSLAVVAVFVATILLVPAVYGGRPRLLR